MLLEIIPLIRMGTLILNNVEKAIANMYTLHSKVHNIQYALRLD